MNQQATQHALRTEPALFKEARIAVAGPANRVTLELPGEGSAEAIVAVAGEYEPRSGDQVLVAGHPGGALYVIGVLVALREVKQQLGMPDGTTAEVTGAPGEETLVVRDSRGILLFEHRPAEGRSVVHAPARNLELRAEGRIELVAQEAVHVRGGREVQVTSEGTLDLAVQAGEAAPSGRITLDAAGVQIAATQLKTLALKIEQVASLVETRAGRLFERTRDTYRETEGLSQTRAGRLKLFAEHTLHAFGKRARIRAEQDLKIDADQIHLG